MGRYIPRESSQIEVDAAYAPRRVTPVSEMSLPFSNLLNIYLTSIPGFDPLLVMVIAMAVHSVCMLWFINVSHWPSFVLRDIDQVVGLAPLNIGKQEMGMTILVQANMQAEFMR